MSTTNLFNLSPQQFVQLVSSQLDLSLLYLFEQYIQGLDPLATCDSSKVKAWRETLIRKGFITTRDEPTLQGKQFYEDLLANKGDIKAVVKRLKEKIDTDFDTWWSNFPGTDGFTVGVKVFKQTRALRVNKDKCRDQFNKMVNAGEYTGEIIIKATLLDIDTRKAASVQSNSNKLSYLNNSLTYLNQKVFDAYVEKVQQGEKAPEIGPGRKTFTL